MSILAVLVVAAVGAAAVLGARTHGRLTTAIGLTAWTVALAATVLVGPHDRIDIGDGTLVATPFGRLMALIVGGTGTLLAIVVAASGVTPVIHGAGLAGLAAVVVAITTTDPATAAWALTGGGTAAVVVGLVTGRGGAGAVELGAALRATATAGAAGIVAVAALGATADPLADPALGSLAFVAAGAGLALRAAAVPFHRWAARIADVAPRPILAPLIAWLPAAAVAVTLAWSDASVAPIAEDLGWARGALVAVALGTLALGGLASWLADDLAHTVAYAAIGAAGMSLLGVSAVDPAAWAATRSVAIVGAATTAGLVAWVVALEGAYRTRRLPDLTGWARGSPVLAVALVLLAWAALGLPGLAILEARSVIADAAIEGPLAWPVWVLFLIPTAGLIRALVAGVRRPDPAILAGAGDRPIRPARPARGDAPPSGSRRMAEELAIAWASINRNSSLVASSAVLAIAVVALVLAAGRLGLPDAAAGPPPGVAAPLDPGAALAPRDVSPST